VTSNTVTLDNDVILANKNIDSGAYTGTQTGFAGDVTGDLTGNVTGDVTGNLSGNAATASILTAPEFYYVGDGSSGAVVQSTDQNYAHTNHEYTTFTLDATRTLTLVDNVPLILRATTSITINGTIDANSKGGDGTFTGIGGTGGSGGGGNVSSGKIGQPFLTTLGGAANGIGNAGLVGNTVTNNDDILMAIKHGVVLNGITANILGGTVGGQGGDSAGVGGVGGIGGGVIILIAPTVTISATGTLDVGGLFGTNGGSNGGGGGGGGGTVIVVTDAGGYTNNGTVDVTGGTGGTGWTSGGVGGDGFVHQIVRL